MPLADLQCTATVMAGSLPTQAHLMCVVAGSAEHSGQGVVATRMGWLVLAAALAARNPSTELSPLTH